MNKLLLSLIFLCVAQAYSMERLPENIAQFAQRKNVCIQALDNARFAQDQASIDIAIEVLRDLQADLQLFKAQFVMNNKIQKQCQIMMNTINAAIDNEHHHAVVSRPKRKLYVYAGQEEPDTLVPVTDQL